ncbi:MAG TPA: tetratricopeptide repeat protein [Thermoanaerobaculia bacterium]|jgi:tetratricopeptide (TPR) repeat protein
MKSPLLTDDRALRDWFNDGHDAAARDAAAMLALPPESWAQWLEEHPEALTYHFASVLLTRSVEARDRDPSEAVALTAFVADRLPRLDVPVPEAGRMLRARTWIERGNALLVADDLPAALAAFEEAQTVPVDPGLPLLAAIARRGAAYTRHRLGDESDEPLRAIRAGIPLFEAHASAGDVLRSRFLEGAIHYERARYDTAREIFEEAARLARDQRDERMLARLANNLGHCERQLGRPDEAVRYLVEAIALFEKLGMTGERFRAEWGIELLRADEGAATAAVTALRATMVRLIDAHRPLEAAQVALDIAELLVLSERHEHVRRLASELVSVFDTAQMSREAVRAFSALRAAAAERVLTVRDVRAAAGGLRGI